MTKKLHLFYTFILLLFAFSKGRAQYVNITPSCKDNTNGTATINSNLVYGDVPKHYHWTGQDIYGKNIDIYNDNPTITDLGPGYYKVELYNENNTKFSQNFFQVNQSFLSSYTLKTISCGGSGSDGAISLTPQGTAPYTFQWSDGSTDQNRTNLMKGNYTVAISDAGGCSENATIEVTDSPEINIGVMQRNDVTCRGGNNGSVQVSAYGGSGNFTYQWDTNPVQSTPSINDLSAGTYTVTVTDDNNCYKTESITISQPDVLSVSYGGQTDVSCHGGKNGTATVNATGGIYSHYNYVWDTNPVQYTATATGLAKGTYTVTVSDAYNCQPTTQSFTITEPTAITATTAQTNVSCNGAANGSASVSASGGTGTLNYSWAPYGGTADTATGLTAGTYSCTITDDTMCSITKTFEITEPNPLDLTVTLAGNILTSNQSGASYQWIQCPATILIGENGQSFTPPTIGSYAVVVTDGSCSVVSTCVPVTTLATPDFEEKSKFVIHPNPSQGIITIASDSDGDYQVINELGQNLKTFKIEANTSNTINLQHLNEGLYFIKGINDTKSKSYKLLIKK